VGIWLAVEDATLENGCLFAASESHKDGVRGRMVLDEGKTGVTWGSGKPDYSDLALEPLEVKAGTIIVLHGSNVHGSNANTSDISRHAYAMHVVEGESAEWLPDNWLQRDESFPFQALYD
jgi:phytanoyl-CoA hydroxylase